LRGARLAVHLDCIGNGVATHETLGSPYDLGAAQSSREVSVSAIAKNFPGDRK
jgi:hypothetical protein